MTNNSDDRIDATDHLQRVIETPIENLHFRDFSRLNSGSDQYSWMKLPRLREAVIENEKIAKEFPDDEESLSKCLRWMLRGLDAEKAIQKVKTDKINKEEYRLRWHTFSDDQESR